MFFEVYNGHPGVNQLGDATHPSVELMWDIANAIRYAVDNGAHIINMSFGKGFSPRKSLVDDAVRYADANGYNAVWTPERHFQTFGGLYPNPSVLGAALSKAQEGSDEDAAEDAPAEDAGDDAAGDEAADEKK